MKKAPTRRGDLRYWLLLAALLWMEPTPRSAAAGTGLILAGAALHLWAKGCLWRNTRVTSWGPYAWVRHPFYLANALVDGGILAWAANPYLAAAAAPLWAAVYAATIRREEAGLSAMLGESYERYRSRVPALLPWRAPLGTAGAPGFSWANSNLRDGREWARLLRILAYPPLLAWVWRLKAGDWLSPESLAAGLAAGALAAAALALLAARRPRRPSPAHP